MTNSESSLAVKVDATNPGQFFACCGLLELAGALCPETEAWFENGQFRLQFDRPFDWLLHTIGSAELRQLDPANDTGSSMEIGEPFGRELNWWADVVAGGKAMKVWAGSMRNVRIARAMQSAIANVPDPNRMFDYGTVVYDPENSAKKVEPFYFDSRRAWNARSRDIGFSPDSFSMTTVAFPAVEFLCLVGLQRCLPAPTDRSRTFIYFSWSRPLPIGIAFAVANGTLGVGDVEAYRFEVAFRTDQKKHKAFFPATPVGAST